MDLIHNGQASGNVAQRLLASNFDPRVLRPYLGKDDRPYITRNMGGKEIAIPTNNATLRYNEWKLLDDAIIEASRPRLMLVNDLRSRGLTYNIPNGMAHTVLMTERQGDITDAAISMDPHRRADADLPEVDLVNLPLPVIHKDFFLTARQLAVSRNNGSPLDTSTAVMAARKVAEQAEQLALGTLGTFAFGGGTIYGITNFPQRITKIMASPVSSPYTPDETVRDLLAMKQASVDKFHYGPWILYVSPAWSQWLDDDYAKSGWNTGITLRERLKKIDGITDIKTADYLTGYQMVLVQTSVGVIREVIGMDMTTVQWESEGGMRLNFKVMAIMVPQIRADINGNTGIVHGTAP